MCPAGSDDMGAVCDTSTETLPDHVDSTGPHEQRVDICDIAAPSESSARLVQIIPIEEVEDDGACVDDLAEMQLEIMDTFSLANPVNSTSEQYDVNVDPVCIISNFHKEDSNDQIESSNEDCVFVIQPEVEDQDDAIVILPSVSAADVNGKNFVVDDVSSDCYVDVVIDPVSEIACHKKRTISDVMERNSEFSYDDGTCKQKVPRIGSPMEILISDISETEKKTCKDVPSTCLSTPLKQSPYKFREPVLTVFETLLKTTENSPGKKNLSNSIDLHLNSDNLPSIYNPIVVLDGAVCDSFQGSTEKVSVVDKTKPAQVEESPVETSVVSSHSEFEFHHLWKLRIYLVSASCSSLL